MSNRAFIIFWLFSLSWFCQAAVQEWKVTGPTGGNIRELIMPEGIGKSIFAASSYGIYRSRNAGRSWESFDRGLNSFSMTALAWQADTQILYAGSQDKGIFRRHLFDEHWTPINKTLPTKNIVDILSCDAGLFISTNQGVFSSTDQGDTWLDVSQGLNMTDKFSNLVIDPQAQIYLAAQTGIFHFDSSSQTWQAENTGLEDVDSHLLSVDVEGNLYASTKSGLFKRTASATTWQKLPSDLFLPAGLNALLIDKTQTLHLLVAGRDGNNFVSQDGGQNWDSLGENSNKNDRVQTFIQDTKDAKLFYFGLRYSGVMLYDGLNPRPFDITPVRLNKSLTNTEISALASHPHNPRFMYAGIKGVSLFTSQDNGQNWQPVLQNFGQAIEASISSILIFPSDENRVLVGTTHGHLYRSDDAGEHWLDLGDVFESAQVYDMKIYGALRGEVVVVATAKGLYKSADNFKTWETLNEGLADTDISALYFSPDPIFSRNFSIGTAQGHVYHSTDFGASWQRQDEGLTDGETINVIIGTNRAPQALYVGTNSGLYYRTNPSAIWQKTSLTYPITDIKTDPVNSNMMVVATTNGVYQSLDAGVNWKSLNDGLSNRHVLKIALSAHPLSIYAGTRGNGIYNLYDFSETDFVLPDIGSNLTTDYIGLSPEAFALFDDAFVSDLSPDRVATLSPEQLNNFTSDAMKSLKVEQFQSISTESLNEISAENLSALNKDVINALTAEQVAILANGSLLEMPSHELGRFVSQLNPNNFSAEDINRWLPGDWQVNSTDLSLKAPIGSKLALPDLNRPDNLSTQIRLPNRVPDLSKSFTLGGDSNNADLQTLESLNIALAELGLSQYHFQQNTDGMLQLYDASNPRASMAFMMDTNDIRQLGEQLSTNLQRNAQGKYQLSLTSQQRFSLLPAPKDSQALLESLGGERLASLRIGDAGDVIFSYSDGTRRASLVHRVVVFDSTIETTDADAGVYDADGESLLVVYNDGTAQLAYAAIPYPDSFIETAYTFSGVEIATCNTDGSCDVQYEGTNLHLSPDLDINVTDLGNDKIDPSIGINSDGTLLYTVQDQAQALAVTIRISF